MFIETPYHNTALFGTLLQTYRPHTLLCLASGLTTAGEYIEAKQIVA